MPRTRRLPRVRALLPVVVLVSACGSGNDDSFSASGGGRTFRLEVTDPGSGLLDKARDHGLV